MILFYLTLGIIYVILMRTLSSHWNKPSEVYPELEQSISASVLVPFRNENQNIPLIYIKLMELDYPDLEVIWIDDLSEDDSLLILNNLMKINPGKLPMKVIRNLGVGKKAAISTGVTAAEGEIIVTTDADCQMSSNWLGELLKPFQDSQIHLVAGPVMSLNEKSFFSKFQQADWSSILLITHTGFVNEYPIMCSGANLAYRRSTFLEINGFDGNDHIMSGDDEFILKKIVSHFGHASAVYAKESSKLIQTPPFQSFWGLIRQRMRWASKWNTHQSARHGIASFIPFAIQVLFISSVFLVFTGPLGLTVFLLLWGVKIISEKMVLGKVLELYGVSIDSLSWIGISVLHPFYVLITAFGAIRGNFEWKGRRNERKN